MGKIFDGSLQDLESYLDERGFKFYKTVEIDNIYIAKDFKKLNDWFNSFVHTNTVKNKFDESTNTSFF